MSTVNVTLDSTIISVQPTQGVVVQAFPAGMKGDKGSVTTLDITLPMSTTLGGGRVVWFDNGMLDYANTIGTNEVVGFTKGAVGDSILASVQNSGELDGFFGLDIGMPIFLADNGLVTQVVPTVGRMQCLGIALSATKILIQIQPPVFLSN